MMIHLVPVTEAISVDELRQRLLAGWVFLGTMPVDEGKGIIDPTKPMTQGGAVVANVWVLPEPTLPLRVLAGLLVHLSKSQVYNYHTLNAVAEKLLGQPLGVVIKAFEPDEPPAQPGGLPIQ